MQLVVDGHHKGGEGRTRPDESTSQSRALKEAEKNSRVEKTRGRGTSCGKKCCARGGKKKVINGIYILRKWGTEVEASRKKKD